MKCVCCDGKGWMMWKLREPRPDPTGAYFDAEGKPRTVEEIKVACVACVGANVRIDWVQP